MAVDRANKALNTLMRAHSMLTPEGAVTVNIDQRRVDLDAVMATLPTPAVRFLAFDPFEDEVAFAIDAIEGRRRSGAIDGEFAAISA